MEIFDYKEITLDGITFGAWDVIQADVEDNLPLFLGKRPEDIRNVVVVGAWQGDEVRSFLRMPRARIFCFEPNPSTFAILQELYKKNNNVFCFQAACSSCNGITKFYETDVEGNGSLLEIDKHLTARQTKSFEVNTVRLDSMSELVGQPIDLLWVDVQGFELEVLKGAENILQNIQALFLEVSTYGSSYKNAVKLSDLEVFLSNHGFFRVAQGFDKQGSEGNALFLRKGNDYRAFIDQKGTSARINQALGRRTKKRKIYTTALFRLMHRLTPQKVRTFLKKQLNFLIKL